MTNLPSDEARRALDACLEAELAWTAKYGKMTLHQLTDRLETLEAEIAALRATPAGGEAGGWRPISTAPDEGEFLVGLHVRHRDPKTHEVIDLYEEQHVIAIDDETGQIDFAYEQGWELSDYEFWKPLDPLPPLPDPSHPGAGGGE